MSIQSRPGPAPVRSSPTEVLSALAADYRRLEREYDKKLKTVRRATFIEPKDFARLAKLRGVPADVLRRCYTASRRAGGRFDGHISDWLLSTLPAQTRKALRSSDPAVRRSVSRKLQVEWKRCKIDELIRTLKADFRFGVLDLHDAHAAAERLGPTDAELEELDNHPFPWACRLVEDELYFQRGILPRLLAHEPVGSPAADRALIQELRRFSDERGWQEALRQLHERFPGTCEALGIVRPVSTRAHAGRGNGVPAHRGGQPALKRRKRQPKPDLTKAEKAAWEAYVRHRTFVGAARERKISRQAATKLIKRAKEKMKAAEVSSRSVPARRTLATDKRGNATATS